MTMKRLPIYVLISTSEDLKGEPIQAIRAGIDMLLDAFRSDPQALETAWLSFITFDSDAVQVLPLTNLEEIQAPSISCGKSEVNLSNALILLMDCIKKETNKNDWLPIIIIFIDNITDYSYEIYIEKLYDLIVGNPIICILFCGDKNIEEKLSKRCVLLHTDTADANSIQRYFIWSENGFFQKEE